MPLLCHTLRGVLAASRHVLWYVDSLSGGPARRRA